MAVKETWTIRNENEYQSVLPEFLRLCGAVNKWQLFGAMGAGKTTFVSQLGLFLGLEGMSSPTFSLVNSYELDNDCPPFKKGLIHHMDLYRLESAEELLDIGWEEYVYSSDGLIVEWPQLALPYWPEPYAEIHLKETTDRSKRELILILPT
jgi:tRNA threonylcarbamoyladenosine biosynthesis protein TsaE